MSSPPPPTLQLNPPKKRPSVSSIVTGSSQPSKKRLTHPLRQTSFPAPDASQFVATPSSAYPRSETGSIVSGYSRTTASLADGAPGSGKRGRGRPRKVGSIAGSAGTGLRAEDDGQTTIKGGGGAQRSLVNGTGGGGGAAGAEDEDDDEEGDWLPDAEGDDMERQEREMKMLDLLTRSFTPATQTRYEAYKRMKFKDTILKRIVNQVVSQSVTKGPLLAINIYSKFFAGEIVERARDVQEEYAKAYDKILEEKWKERDRQEETWLEKERKAASNESNTTSDNKPGDVNGHAQREINGTSSAPTTKKDETDSSPTNNPTPRKLPPPPYPETTLSGYENPHRGGLLPEHLREAVRRYQADGEGGGVGFDGMSLAGLGVQGRRSWTTGRAFGGTSSAGGKRLFG